MNQTANYQLNQWESTDRILMADFNADNAKLDAALKAQSDAIAAKAAQSTVAALTQTVSTKASQSALDSLTQTVSTKAEAAAVTALSQTVAGHTTALAGKGNCQIYYTTYAGNGQTSRTLTFPAPPLEVTIHNNGKLLRAVRGADLILGNDDSPKTFPLTWNGNSITWTMNNDTMGLSNGCNYVGYTYYVLALIAADE